MRPCPVRITQCSALFGLIWWEQYTANNVGSRRNHLSEIRWKTFFVVFAISLRLLPLHAADELHDGAIDLGCLGHHEHDGLGISAVLEH